ncbi:hypothetical protein GQ607_015420 [Colletotrichum asianum]|uniref:Uncharacterized protein n=1 Tax=Colletotrichum asianum TaxID=702518 RepID=A0A8H3W353_9PEZI|nr:hypothetical protein GQ607_015420 [Colletotrichum asianum]
MLIYFLNILLLTIEY